MAGKPKTRRLWRGLLNYVRYDLREIILPRPMPDPPDFVPERKLSLKDYLEIIKATNRRYMESWKSPPKEEPQGKATEAPTGNEPTFWEDLSAAAKGGAQTLTPFLKKVYASRTVAYRDSVRSFVEGYREGLQAGPVLGDWDPTSPSTTKSEAAESQGAEASGSGGSRDPLQPSSGLSGESKRSGAREPPSPDTKN
eukprot:jgi/Botrbrau1/21624/Bobra.43_1s0026.1